MGTSLSTASVAGEGDKCLFVMDSTANVKFPVREHELIVGYDGDIPIIETYEFRAHKRLELPFAHAVKFLPHKEFIVTEDAEGSRRFDPTPAKPDSDKFTLAPDQVVASLSELTADALLIRCNQIPGGEGLKRNHGKDALISFLTEHAEASGKTTVEETVPVDGEDSLVGGDMSEGELKEMLGD